MINPKTGALEEEIDFKTPRKPWEEGQVMTETGLRKLHANECQELLANTRSQSPKLPEGVCPAGTVLLDFWSPDLQWNTFLLFAEQ